MRKSLFKLLIAQVIITLMVVTTGSMNVLGLGLEEDPAPCLLNCLPTEGEEVTIGECWQEYWGGDIFNGNIINCSGEGGYCQKTFCDKKDENCYVPSSGTNQSCGDD
jgi:hypothetical protein